jgi:hypothetical protein
MSAQTPYSSVSKRKPSDVRVSSISAKTNCSITGSPLFLEVSRQVHILFLWGCNGVCLWRVLDLDKDKSVAGGNKLFCFGLPLLET